MYADTCVVEKESNEKNSALKSHFFSYDWTSFSQVEVLTVQKGAECVYFMYMWPAHRIHLVRPFKFSIYAMLFSICGVKLVFIKWSNSFFISIVQCQKSLFAQGSLQSVQHTP